MRASKQNSVEQASSGLSERSGPVARPPDGAIREETAIIMNGRKYIGKLADMQLSV